MDASTSASTTPAGLGSSRSIPIPISPTKPGYRAWRGRRAGNIRSWFVVSRKEPCAKRSAPRPRVNCSLRRPSPRPLRLLRPLRSLRPVERAHRARLEQLTRATGLFREEEVATAVELLDASLAGDDDYRFVGAFDGDELIGYACWGPTPGTEATHDLYWIVVEREHQGRGIGTQLLAEVEQRLTTHAARLIVVETSSRPDYAPTRSFYEARGYARTATIPRYYAPGDDLVIYTKDLT